MFYDVRKALKHDSLFYFLHGARGIGKTFSIKSFFTENFLEKGEEFFYLRRYGGVTMANATQNFFASLQKEGYYTDYKFSQKGNNRCGHFYLNDSVIGHYSSLTSFKGSEFPNVTYINFDEYLADENDIYHSYLTGEVTHFLEFYESIARMRDVKVLFTSNRTDSYSPYWNYFNLKKPYGKKTYWKGKNVYYEEIKSDDDFIAKKYGTRFGEIIKGTAYGDYNVENGELYNLTNFVKKKTPTAKNIYNVRIGEKLYGLYDDIANGEVFFSCDYNSNLPTYTLIKKDRRPNEILLKGKSFHLNILRKSYQFSQLYFDSEKSAKAFSKIEKLL